MKTMKWFLALVVLVNLVFSIPAIAEMPQPSPSPSPAPTPLMEEEVAVQEFEAIAEEMSYISSDGPSDTDMILCAAGHSLRSAACQTYLIPFPNLRGWRRCMADAAAWYARCILDATEKAAAANQMQ